MLECPECGSGFKSKGGLAGHRRAKHPVEARARGTIFEAVSDQVPDDAPTGLRAAALKLSAAMDATESTRDLASLSRELRATLAEIGSGDDESEADGVDDLAARRAARRADAAGVVGS